MAGELPPGFTLDAPQAAAGLPLGFKLDAPAPKAPPSMRQQLTEGFVDMVRPGGPGKSLMEGIDRLSNKAGETVTDALQPHVRPEIAAGAGALANTSTQAVPMLFGGEVGKVVQPAMEGAGKWVMQKALKPTTADFVKGKADRAVQTLLDEGINVTRGGVEKLRNIGSGLNNQVEAVIADSAAKIRAQKILDSLDKTRDKFATRPSAVEDFASIQKEGDKFATHPTLSGLGAKEAELEANVTQKNAARISALQNSGRYQTMAAQQQNLAHGGGVNLAPRGTPLNEPYMNVGSETLGGGRSLSPSAYPVQEGMVGNVRTPGQYTHNIERVPEASSAAAEFEKIAKIRQLEKEAAEIALSSHRANGGSDIPIQLAQKLKQGFYQELKDNYGTMGSAATEAQKTMANALRMEMEKGAPSIAPLNKRASEIWNALNVTERRALQQGNKDIGGLTALAGHPATAAAFAADRSALVKSLLARGLYSGKIPENLGRGAGLAYGMQDQGEGQ